MSVHIPSWAVKLGGGLITLLVPWMAYITLGVESLKANWELQRETNRQVLTNLEKLSNFGARIVAMEKAIERLEDQHFRVTNEKPAQHCSTGDT